MAAGPAVRAVRRPGSAVLLLDDGVDVAGGQDYVVVALELVLGAAELRVDDLVAHADVHGYALAVLELARADGDDLALGRLLLGRVGDDDARGGGLLLVDRLHHDAVLKGTKLQCHSLLLAFLGLRNVSTRLLRVP